MNRSHPSPNVARLRLIVFGVLGLLIAGPVPGAGGQPASSPRGSDIFAVAPFDRLGGQPTDEWLGAGMAETLSGVLSRAGLSTLAPGVVRQALAIEPDAPGPDPSSIFEALRLVGVTHVVRGSVQHVGSRIRVTARVIDLGTGAITESARVDGDVQDVFATQDETGAALVEALRSGGGYRGGGS